MLIRMSYKNRIIQAFSKTNPTTVGIFINYERRNKAFNHMQLFLRVIKHENKTSDQEVKVLLSAPGAWPGFSLGAPHLLSVPTPAVTLSQRGRSPKAIPSSLGQPRAGFSPTAVRC